MKGDQGGYNRKNRRMARSKNKGSDESDEDYMVSENEVSDDTEDEYHVSFDGDESEEILDELEEDDNEEEEEEEEDEGNDDEEEEFQHKKVRTIGRPKVKKTGRARGRDKKGVRKPKKKRRSLYGDDGDGDDDDDVDYVFEDKKTNKFSRPRKKRISYREDVDDSDSADYCSGDKKIKEVSKPRKKKRVLYREEEDDYDGEDYNIEGERIHGVAKPSKNKKLLYRDGDYSEFDDETVEVVVKPRQKKRFSYREDDDDSDAKFDHEKQIKLAEPRKRKVVSYRERDDDDDDDDDEEEEDYAIADDGFDDDKVTEIVESRDRKKATCGEGDDDYDYVEDEYDDEKNEVVEPRGKRKASYREEDDKYDVAKDKFDVENTSEVAKPRKKKEALSHGRVDDYECTDDDDDDEDYDGTDENDDDEFTPDEIDSLEDEIDSLHDEDDVEVMKKNKRVGRSRLQEKVITRGRKRKRNSKALEKTMRKKLGKNCQPSTEVKAEVEGEFIDTKPIVEEKNKKVTGRRKRGKTVNSDTDFESSGSSDYDYTISEEERELIEEANEFSRSSITNLRSSTSSKKLEEEKEILGQKKRPARKGKEKIEDLNVEAGKQVCGICLTEEGKRTVRGTLDCCSHYFCFACIMEWSKVESRCPLCKQRFVTISKPARLTTGFDLRTVVIQIPERDQVYQPSEEELQGFLDPYDNVICTECHQGGDDALMLLCDICDSPAHTYCVGLGHEVPDGNWYCEGCRPTAAGASNPQGLTTPPDIRSTGHSSVRSSPVSTARETFDLNEMYVPDTPLTPEPSQLPSPRPPVGDVQLPSPASGSGAFTVLERRRIHHQINQLRRRQMDGRALETPSTVSGHRLFGSQVGLSRDIATQHALIPERISSNTTYFYGSLQDNSMSSLHNVPSARLSHIAGEPSQSQPSSSTIRPVSGNTQNWQLQPCSGRSSVGSDAGRPPYQFREVVVPSRSLQGALHTPF